MKPNLSIAVCQMTSVDDVEANFRQMQSLLDSVSTSLDIAFFPENCLYMRLKEGASIPGLTLQDPIFSQLTALAKSRQTTLHLGSLPLREGEKLTNATVTVSADGKVECTYRKMHLFDISLEGQKPVKESDAFHHGPSPSVLDLHSWKIGQTICYDLRFAELFSAYAKQKVDLIAVPSSFLVATGKAHWEVLLRARAIESQCYVVAAAQAGTHSNASGHQRATYGHSLIVSPWGEILAQGSADRPQALVSVLEKSQVEAVRRQIPMHSHRRL
jgi:predicted amidohydrolase